MTRRRLGLGTPNEGQVVMPYRQLPPGKQGFDVASSVTNLRQHLAKAEAFTTTADELFEEVRDDPRRRERLAWIVEAAAVETRTALAACNKLAADVAKHGVGT